MNKELQETLFRKYPDFFKHKNNLKVSLMAFGFECKDGWYSLIDKLCHDIWKYFITEYEGKDWDGNVYHHEIPPFFYVVQVKEKYGSLRFYVTSAPEKVHTMIREAELKSYYICEQCGKEGKQFYRDKLGWIQTLCDTCLDKHIMKKSKKVRKKDEDYISEWQRDNGAPYKLG